MTAALRIAEPVPPPDAQELPAAAADHVVERVREGSCCDHRRRTITRSGSWVRDERLYADRSETGYSDFASGTSLRIWRDGAGEVRTVAIERSRSRRSPLFPGRLARPCRQPAAGADDGDRRGGDRLCRLPHPVLIGYRIHPPYRAFGFASTFYLNLGLIVAALWLAAT